MKEKTTLSDIGARGEERICAVLAAISGARLYRNVYIPRKNGSTVEIDAILLSQKGLIVVECKAFLHGDITGSIQRYEWTRAYRKKGTRYPVRTKFYNPIKQNDDHIEAIIRALGVPRGACHSLIVFAQGAVLKKVPPNTGERTIVQEGALRSVVAKRLSEGAVCFPPDEVQRVGEALERMVGVARQTKKNHVAFAMQAYQHRLAKRERRR